MKIVYENGQGWVLEEWMSTFQALQIKIATKITNNTFPTCVNRFEKSSRTGRYHLYLASQSSVNMGETTYVKFSS